MAVIQFYEKSGCSGNSKQKALLTAAGHEVQARDLRDVCWSRERLLSFLSPLPVAEWFNKSATAVKDGTIVPEELDEATALGLLQENPLLIRRPLMEVDGSRMVGFDTQAVAAWIGLGDQPLPTRNMESCANHAHDHGDGQPHRCHDPRAEAVKLKRLAKDANGTPRKRTLRTEKHHAPRGLEQQRG